MRLSESDACVNGSPPPFVNGGSPPVDTLANLGEEAELFATHEAVLNEIRHSRRLRGVAQHVALMLYHECRQRDPTSHEAKLSLGDVQQLTGWGRQTILDNIKPLSSVFDVTPGKGRAKTTFRMRVVRSVRQPDATADDGADLSRCVRQPDTRPDTRASGSASVRQPDSGPDATAAKIDRIDTNLSIYPTPDAAREENGLTKDPRHNTDLPIEQRLDIPSRYDRNRDRQAYRAYLVKAIGGRDPEVLWPVYCAWVRREGKVTLDAEAGFIGWAKKWRLLPAPAAANGRKEAVAIKDKTTDEDVAPLCADPALAERSARVRTHLRARLGEDVYTSWFQSLEFMNFDGETVRVSVPVKFLRNWIETHYGEDLLACCSREFVGAARVEVGLREPRGGRPVSRQPLQEARV